MSSVGVDIRTTDKVISPVRSPGSIYPRQKATSWNNNYCRRSKDMEFLMKYAARNWIVWIIKGRCTTGLIKRANRCSGTMPDKVAKAKLKFTLAWTPHQVFIRHKFNLSLEIRFKIFPELYVRTYVCLCTVERLDRALSVSRM